MEPLFVKRIAGGEGLLLPFVGKFTFIILTWPFRRVTVGSIIVGKTFYFPIHSVPFHEGEGGAAPLEWASFEVVVAL